MELTYEIPDDEALSFDENVTENDGVYICSTFECVGTPPVLLPSKAHRDEYGSCVCENYKKTDYNNYLQSLKNDGFDTVETKYDDAYLSKPGCAVFLSYYEKDKELKITWYETSPYAPENGLLADEAEKLLCYEKSLSKIKLRPIDITPKGFYELTGAQIYAVPEYSHDYYASTGQDDLIFEDNEYYSCDIKLVLNKKVYDVRYDCIAVTDIDVDGKEDICLLQYGPTSGLFTFVVDVITDGEVIGNCFCTDHYDLSFVNINNRLFIKGVTQENEYHTFKIKLEEYEGQRYLELYENGEPISTFFRQGE